VENPESYEKYRRRRSSRRGEQREEDVEIE
jgi:hypothetical protein